jgi:two-component system sensor histidine kinase MprB
MLGRPGQVRRAVLNLLTNAVKYDPSGEPVDVTITAAPPRPGAGPRLRLCVRDRGPGIAEADLAHATERFWRAATARGLPGSGLGLAIVADVATRNGGVLTLGPADPGADPPGLTACLDLPAPARDVGA